MLSVVLDAERFTEREFSIPADLARLGEAMQFAEEAAAEFGFDDGLRYQVKLATNEAVANAMEHGSPSTDSSVRVRALEEDGGLALYVHDSGSFSARTPPPGGQLPERGRGLEFMMLLMDEVEVLPSADGTVIRLVKHLSG